MLVKKQTGFSFHQQEMLLATTTVIINFNCTIYAVRNDESIETFCVQKLITTYFILITQSQNRSFKGLVQLIGLFVMLRHFFYLAPFCSAFLNSFMKSFMKSANWKSEYVGLFKGMLDGKQGKEIREHFAP